MPLNDQSGWENSCPHIDGVIDVLNRMSCDYTCDDVKWAIKKLERVREINDGIRTWGNEQWDFLDDSKREIERLESIIGDLKYELRRAGGGE